MLVYLVGLGEVGVPKGLICLNTFWDDNVIPDAYYYYLLIDLSFLHLMF